jgi:4-hydroxybenzoate polyprenyltransferase
MIVALVAFGLTTPELGRWYWIGLAAASVLLLVEHVLVRGRDLMRVNVAFFHVNGIISVGLMVATLLDLYVR